MQHLFKKNTLGLAPLPLSTRLRPPCRLPASMSRVTLTAMEEFRNKPLRNYSQMILNAKHREHAPLPVWWIWSLPEAQEAAQYTSQSLREQMLSVHFPLGKSLATGYNAFAISFYSRFKNNNISCSLESLSPSNLWQNEDFMSSFCLHIGSTAQFESLIWFSFSMGVLHLPMPPSLHTAPRNV